MTEPLPSHDYELPIDAEHCVVWDEVCARDNGNDDHADRCCSCGRRVREREHRDGCLTEHTYDEDDCNCRPLPECHQRRRDEKGLSG